jgi:hypothetical protein
VPASASNTARGSFFLGARAVLAVLGALALVWHPSAAWIERSYVNGFYPHWEHVAFELTSPFPWSLGDVAVLLGVAALLWRFVAFLRGRRGASGTGRLVLDVLAIAGLYAVWFEVAWGWNYDRAPIQTRIQFDAGRVTARAALALRSRAIAHMNALAAPAHARAGDPVDLAELRRAWLAVVQRGGDDWVPQVGPPKPTLAGPFMDANGTSGFVNPLTLNVASAPDLLWFERPFDVAHEWSHVAAYAREDEANYIAVLACLRSHDPVLRYSGWLELFLYLPQKRHYAKREFVPLVWQDFAAMRKRNRLHINVLFAHWSWRTYNAYLKGNRIVSGLQNYNEVTRLVLGAPLDAQGLPIAR